MGDGADDRARVEELLTGLAAQIQAEAAVDDDLAAEELIRAEHGRISWMDRVRACSRAGLHLPDGTVLTGRVVAVYSDGVVLAVGDGEDDGDRLAREDVARMSRGEVIVTAASIIAISGVGPSMRPPSTVESRLGVASELRRWCADQSQVRCRRATGEVSGELVRVGADHIDLRCREPDTLGSLPGVRGEAITVPLAAVWSIRRD